MSYGIIVATGQWYAIATVLDDFCMVDGLPSYSEVAERLRNLRMSHGRAIDLPDLEARQFAQLLGVGQAKYAAYERGERDPPASFLALLRFKTGVDLNWLCCGDEPPISE